jgi:hypothetical protein
MSGQFRWMTQTISDGIGGGASRFRIDPSRWSLLRPHPQRRLNHPPRLGTSGAASRLHPHPANHGCEIRRQVRGIRVRRKIALRLPSLQPTAQGLLARAASPIEVHADRLRAFSVREPSVQRQTTARVARARSELDGALQQPFDGCTRRRGSAGGHRAWPLWPRRGGCRCGCLPCKPRGILHHGNVTGCRWRLQRLKGRQSVAYRFGMTFAVRSGRGR